MAKSTLHEQMKYLYAAPDGKTEVVVDGYVIDAVRDSNLYEIQTAGLHNLRKKLTSLCVNHSVTIVFPVAQTRTIVRIDAKGKELNRRKSPKRGSYVDIFEELVSLAGLLPHPQLRLELVLIEENQFRIDDGNGSWRRRRVSLVGRELVRVVDSRELHTANDYLSLLPQLPSESPFTTAHLAQCLGCSRWFAQKVAYFLSRGGGIERVGRRRGGTEYVLSSRNGLISPPGR